MENPIRLGWLVASESKEDLGANANDETVNKVDFSADGLEVQKAKGDIVFDCWLDYGKEPGSPCWLVQAIQCQGCWVRKFVWCGSDNPVQVTSKFKIAITDKFICIFQSLQTLKIWKINKCIRSLWNCKKKKIGNI